MEKITDKHTKKEIIKAYEKLLADSKKKTEQLQHVEEEREKVIALSAELTEKEKDLKEREEALRKRREEVEKAEQKSEEKIKEAIKRVRQEREIEFRHQKEIWEMKIKLLTAENQKLTEMLTKANQRVFEIALKAVSGTKQRPFAGPRAEDSSMSTAL